MATEYNKVKADIKEVGPGEETEVQVEKVKKEAVVKRKPKKYKKNLLERLVIGLIGPDGIPAIGRKLNEDIVIPAVKNIIVDSFTSGINMAIFGTDQRREGRSGGYHGQAYGGQRYRQAAPKTNYSQSYTQPTQQAPMQTVPANRNAVPDYIIEVRTEAIDVLDGLRDQVMEYGYASVSDYYDLIGVQSAYTDESWGWDNLEHARIVTARGGYLIRFPELIKIG